MLLRSDGPIVVLSTLARALQPPDVLSSLIRNPAYSCHLAVFLRIICLHQSSNFHTNYHPNLIGLWRRLAFRALLTHQYILHDLEVVRLGKLACATLNASRTRKCPSRKATLDMRSFAQLDMVYFTLSGVIRACQIWQSPVNASWLRWSNIYSQPIFTHDLRCIS